MSEELKQSLIDLLTSAKSNIEAGETQVAIEEIENALAAIENDGVATADGEGGDKFTKPLPGQGNNGGIVKP